MALSMETAAIGARNDIEAVSTWLSARAGRSQNTFEAFRREAIRFLTWLHERSICMAVVTVEDAHQYLDHLRNPPSHWIRPRKLRSGIKATPTQLVSGPLSESSVAYSRRVLALLYGYLQDAGYLSRNPFKLSSRPTTVTPTTQHRFLDLDCWLWLWEWACSRKGKTRMDVRKIARDRWLLALLYNTGIRRGEAAEANFSDFVRTNQHWSLRIVGKGLKERYVTINSSLLSELKRYRNQLGLPVLPTPSDHAPLVCGLRGNHAVTSRQIGNIISEIFKGASYDCPDAHMRSALREASTHWMRHTYATHRLQAGAALTTTQDELGHADPKTTRIYAKTSDKSRREDAEKISAISK